MWCGGGGGGGGDGIAPETAFVAPVCSSHPVPLNKLHIEGPFPGVHHDHAVHRAFAAQRVQHSAAVSHAFFSNDGAVFVLPKDVPLRMLDTHVVIGIAPAVDAARKRSRGSCRNTPLGTLALLVTTRGS